LLRRGGKKKKAGLPGKEAGLSVWSRWPLTPEPIYLALRIYRATDGFWARNFNPRQWPCVIGEQEKANKSTRRFLWVNIYPTTPGLIFRENVFRVARFKAKLKNIEVIVRSRYEGCPPFLAD
jgi:hypothetical protein